MASSGNPVLRELIVFDLVFALAPIALVMGRGYPLVFYSGCSLLGLLLLRVSWCWRKRWKLLNCALDGLCPKCGYDLRESEERCPECGLRFAETPDPFG